MSMPLQSTPPEAPEPAAPEAAEPAAPAAPALVPPAEPEQPAVHPAWLRTFDEAGIPDMLRPKLVEQITRSEAEANKRVESARADAIPAEWKEFIELSTGAQASPQDLIQSWNATQEMLTDPFTHIANFQKAIDAAVAEGRMTRPEGQQLKKEQAAEVEELASFDTPEQKQIAELLKWKKDQETATATAKGETDAQAYADQFYTELDGQLKTGGYELNQAQYDSARDFADTALFNDKTGSLTIDAAIRAGIQRLSALGVVPKAAAAAATPPLPVGGGGNSVPGIAPKKFSNAKEREAAMMAAASEFFSSNQ